MHGTTLTTPETASPSAEGWSSRTSPEVSAACGTPRPQHVAVSSPAVRGRGRRRRRSAAATFVLALVAVTLLVARGSAVQFSESRSKMALLRSAAGLGSGEEPDAGTLEALERAVATDPDNTGESGEGQESNAQPGDVLNPPSALENAAQGPGAGFDDSMRSDASNRSPGGKNGGRKRRRRRPVDPFLAYASQLQPTGLGSKCTTTCSQNRRTRVQSCETVCEPHGDQDVLQAAEERRAAQQEQLEAAEAEATGEDEQS